MPTDPADAARPCARWPPTRPPGSAGPGLPRLAAVGLACAGIVDPVTGWLGRSPNLPGWENRDLARRHAAAFGDVPVALANDVNAALYGEFRFGAGRGCRDLVMIALGTGVGGGVIVDGTLLIGAHSGAGEIGHMVAGARRSALRLRQPRLPRGLLRQHRPAARRRASCWPAAPLRRRLAALARRRGAALNTRDLADLAEAGDARRPRRSSPKPAGAWARPWPTWSTCWIPTGSSSAAAWRRPAT